MCIKTWHLFTWIVSLSWHFISISAAVPPTQASTNCYIWTSNQMLWVFKPLAGFGTSLPALSSPHVSSPFMTSKNHLPKILFSYCHCPVLPCLSVLNVGSDFSPNLMELKPLLWLFPVHCSPCKHLMLPTHQSSPDYLPYPQTGPVEVCSAPWLTIRLFLKYIFLLFAVCWNAFMDSPPTPPFLNLGTTSLRSPSHSSRSVRILPHPRGLCSSLQLTLTLRLWIPNTFIISQSYFSQMIHILLCFGGGGCSVLSKRSWLLSLGLICQLPKQLLAGSHEFREKF